MEQNLKTSQKVSSDANNRTFKDINSRLNITIYPMRSPHEGGGKRYHHSARTAERLRFRRRTSRRPTTPMTTRGGYTPNARPVRSTTSGSTDVLDACQESISTPAVTMADTAHFHYTTSGSQAGPSPAKRTERGTRLPVSNLRSAVNDR